MAQPSDYLAGLNQAQRQAVEHGTGPLLIVAGAGTGKTTVLVNRLLHLIMSGQARPEQILLTTFTEKAAGEMEERSDRLLPYGYTDLWIQTFHGLGERLLRQHGLDIGLPADFKLLNETGQWILLRKNLDRLQLDYYRPLGNETKFLRELVKHFSHLKDENISPEDYLRYVDGLDLSDAGEPQQIEVARLKELARAYQTYNQLLLDHSYLDFGDLIRYTLQLFHQRPNILQHYRQQFKFILVDEFQDTNWAQYELIKLLAAPDNNLTVVGDDDQSIYKFRGASLANILQFKDDFPTATEIVLTSNYRSGQEILDKAYQSIQHNNPDRLEAKLQLNKQLSAASSIGGTVEVWPMAHESEEVIAIIDDIKNIHQTDGVDIKWSDFAILIRSNRDADKFINELGRQKIPCQFMSLRGLYYKPVILDCLAYFKLLDNYHESASLYRVLSSRAFAVSAADLIELNALARRKAWSLFEVLQNSALATKLTSAGRSAIDRLLKLVSEQSQAAATQQPSRLFVDFVYKSGLLAGLDQEVDWSIFHYLNQLYKKIKDFENEGTDLRLKDFVNLMDLEMESGETGSLSLPMEDDDVVRIMTIHSAKGLEFRYVYLPDLVDKRFPTIRRGDSLPIPDGLIAEAAGAGDIHLAEERRLFYVAMTRAKEKLVLAYARDYGGARDKRPSVFLSELGLTDGVAERQLDAARTFELVREVEALAQPEADLAWPAPALAVNKFSFSQFEAYGHCPLQYKFSFVLHVPVPEKCNMVYGRLMHRCLYEFFAPCLADDQPVDLFGQSTSQQHLDWAQLLAVYKKNWTDDGYSSAEEREKYRQLGQQSLKLAWQKVEADGWPTILALEKKFVWKTARFALGGTIDRVDQLPDGTVEIIDYKTGNPKDKLDYQTKRQLMIYQLAVEDVFGWRVGRLTFYYLNNGTSLSFTAKPADLEKVQQEVAAEVESIRQGIFPAQPSQLCAYCDFRTICQFRQT